MSNRKSLQPINMTMKITRLIQAIYTTDLQWTVDFYAEKLGFICFANEPDQGWARVQIDNADLMISKPNDHIQFGKPSFTGSFYFNTDNVDEV